LPNRSEGPRNPDSECYIIVKFIFHKQDKMVENDGGDPNILSHVKYRLPHGVSVSRKYKTCGFLSGNNNNILQSQKVLP
jgi:hypothetical protein